MLKFMAAEGCDRKEAQGNMDAYFENPQGEFCKQIHNMYSPCEMVTYAQGEFPINLQFLLIIVIILNTCPNEILQQQQQQQKTGHTKDCKNKTVPQRRITQMPTWIQNRLLSQLYGQVSYFGLDII